MMHQGYFPKTIGDRIVSVCDQAKSNVAAIKSVQRDFIPPHDVPKGKSIIVLSF